MNTNIPAQVALTRIQPHGARWFAHLSAADSGILRMATRMRSCAAEPFTESCHPALWGWTLINATCAGIFTFVYKCPHLYLWLISNISMYMFCIYIFCQLDTAFHKGIVFLKAIISSHKKFSWCLLYDIIENPRPVRKKLKALVYLGNPRFAEVPMKQNRTKLT